MNALVRKEIRSLLPLFGGALALTLSMWMLPDLQNEGANWLLTLLLPGAPAMALLMCIESFGRELNSGTFSMLLSQPVARLSVWRIKASILFGALAVLVVAWLFTCMFAPAAGVPGSHRAEFAVLPGVFALALYSSALWTVLLLRQPGVAFWISILIPLALSVATGFGAEKMNEKPLIYICGTLILYSIAGYFFAQRLFLRAQDIQWGGGVIQLPTFTFAGQTARSQQSSFRPVTALFRREFRLHEAQWIIAGSLLLLHLGALASSRVDGLSDSARFVSETIWVLWLFIPTLVGCAAIAEERKLGTLESALCLPVRRRTQFLVKLSVVLFLTLVFGVLVPVLLEGRRILPDPDSKMFLNLFLPGLARLDEVASFLAFAAPILLIGFTGFYFSSLTRSTLHGLGPAVLALAVAVAVNQAAFWPEAYVGYPLWRGPIAQMIGVPILLAVILALAFWNLSRTVIGWPLWRRNIAVLAASGAFAIVLSSATYHRAWEFLTSDQAHGPARLENAELLPLGRGNYAAILPDSRIWVGHWPGFGSTNRLESSAMIGGFLSGSNWMAIVRIGGEFITLKTDGTLWVSREPEVSGRGVLRDISVAWVMVPLSEDSDWKQVARIGSAGLLLKKNGSLWMVGPEVGWQSGTNDHWPGLRAFPLRSISTPQIEWTEMIPIDDRVALRTTTGAVYSGLGENREEQVSIGGYPFGRVQALEQGRWSDISSVWRWGLPPALAGITPDGRLEIFGQMEILSPRNTRYVSSHTPLHSSSDWIACASHPLIALRQDGTLWRWRFKRNSDFEVEAVGNHRDWIGVAVEWYDVMTLAKDGSLWRYDLMGDFGEHHPADQLQLLAPSRKPHWLGNIFGSSDRQ
ncbi:MAG TPA: hypothetical protein VEH04_17710 [Verrucomicrobiae bacterium]|nr:hypothetical protein [Verrucomicrobiae bacterium]